MRTLSKKIKKWLRIFITLDIFYEEIRSFLGILLNCTSLFYVKSFCCWCPIISPIYSAMYVSNVWMRHCVILQNGKFSYYDIGSKVDVQSLHNLCIQKNQHSTFGKSLKNDSTQLSISSKWISLIKCDLRAKVHHELEFVQFTMYKVFLHKCIFFFVFCSSHFFSVSQKDKHKTNWSAVHITENAPWMWYFFMILYHLQLFTQTISSMESRLE